MADQQQHTPSDEELRPVKPRQVRSSGQAPRKRPAARHAAQHAAKRPAARGGKPAQRPAQRQSAARPAAARGTSPVPIIIAVVLLLLVGVGIFFVVRSCSSARTEAPQQNAQTQATDQGNNQAQAGAAQGTTDGSTDINLLMVGDMLFHYQVRQSGLQSDGTRNYDHLFTHVLDELGSADIKVINQETPLGGNVYTGTAPDGYDGYPEFNGPQEVGDAEAKAGFNVVLKATNHAMDNSGNFDDPYTLVKSEQTFWKTKHPEVAVIGEADPDDANASVDDVYVYEKNGFKVALLNYTQDLNGNEANDRQGVVSMLEEEHVKATMAKAREMADMIVVFPHWGEEYNLEPVEMQYEWAQLFVDEGADVIIGNHPHVMEPVTVYEGEGGKKVPCYWSTGNFVSTSPSDESLMGGMARVTLHKNADGSCAVTAASFVPMVTHLGMTTDMTTYLLKDWTNDLASTNQLFTDINNADNTGMTPAWCNEFCTQLFGSGFNAEKSVVEIDLTQAQQKAPAEPTATAESPATAEPTAATAA